MNSLNILFTGDFAPVRGFESLVIEKREKIFGNALSLIQSADLSFVNLECPLTMNNCSINKSGPALKAHSDCAEALKPFSVIGLANNHILDYGEEGLSDTLLACKENGLPTVGAGLDIRRAQKPYVKDISGVKVAIIALAEYEFNQSENDGAGSAPIDLIDNYQQIKQAKNEADIVIVTLHGGNEYFPYPRPGLRKLCQHFIELGVDAVICHHPHVPGAYEHHKGKPIVYSLGNLIFDHMKPPKGWDVGYMAQLKFDRDTMEFSSLELLPYSQSVKVGGLKLHSGDEKQAFLDNIDSYREKLENHNAWLQEWQSFVQKQANSYILRQFFPVTFRGLGLLARNTPIPKLLFNKNNGLAKLNMLRCQSHRELLITALESKSQLKQS